MIYIHRSCPRDRASASGPNESHTETGAFFQNLLIKKCGLGKHRRLSNRSIGRLQGCSSGRDTISFLKEDPLWERVQKEFLHVLEPQFSCNLKKAILGPLDPKMGIIDIYCATREIKDILQRYDYILLPIFQQYFPRLSSLRVKVFKESPSQIASKKSTK